MTNNFVHLRVRTEYSIVDSLIRVNDLAKRASELNMPAIAVTEYCNLFSAVKFYKSALSHGIKPVIGAEIIVEDGFNGAPSNLILFCQNQTGYQNLCRLITKSYLCRQNRGLPAVSINDLPEYSDGIIAMSTADNASLASAIVTGNADLASKYFDYMSSTYQDRFCMEILRIGKPDEEYYIEQAVMLSGRLQIPLIASNNIRFLKQEDYEAHEVRVCIQQGRVLDDPRRPREFSSSQYLKSPDEMIGLFEDIPEAVQNASRLAQRCNLVLELDNPHMPDYPTPPGYDQASLLIEKSMMGLNDRVIPNARETGKDVSVNDYESRLKRELDVITSMGFSGYFLIVADFIDWARQQRIPVGPGRGSGAGSLVAYALGITDLDPINYDLLFERFLNPERISLPDFDIDFCMERRDEVIDYVAERYGREQVSQIITYGTMAAKAVVRDVGRALGHPYGFVDQIAKLVPFELNMTLERALADEQLLRERYDNEEEVRILMDLALKLEGLCRNAGRHAGGLVIAPRPLTEYMPLYCEQGSKSTVTQFDMKDVEAIGLVKFDFLGLRTLTIIDKAVSNINKQRFNSDEGLLDISKIPLNDPATYELIRRTETTAVFQLESDGMRKLIKRLRPDVFEDLVALVALFRPGPLQSGMVDDFVDRKHGQAKVHYLLPILEQVLKPTYGVILYQEQVMQIAQIMAGYSLGAADLLRRAMGKKKPEEMAQQRDIFISGAIENGIDKRIAASIFDLMEKFAGYGFNKSHSAAYALIAYQTAWLKAHYPAAFMAAVLSSDMDNTDKVVNLCEEIRKMQLELAPPCINNSLYEFSVPDPQTIRYGMGAIKGVGKSAIDVILESRPENGFTDIFDFCKRCDTRKVNRRVMEALIRSGAMDCLGESRSKLNASLDMAIQYAEQSVTNAVVGQNDMFGLSADTKPVTGQLLSDISTGIKEWTEEERLQGEKDTLGFYLKGHPIERYEHELSQFISARLSDIKPGESSVIVAGYISTLRTRAGRRGRMAEIRLDDRTARAPVTVYSDSYQKFRPLLLKDQLIVVRGKVEYDDFYDIGYAIIVDEIMDLVTMRAKHANIHINIKRNDQGGDYLDSMKKILREYLSGGCHVVIEYYNGSAYARLCMGDDWRVRPEDKLLENLRSCVGKDNVRLHYRFNGSTIH
jgi:DNA polymerase III subunit alpha